MKRYLFVLFISFLFFGCGYEVVDAPDNTNQLLLGRWDSISNTPFLCHERIKFNPDNTFWWYESKTINFGTYERDKDRLDFMFTNKANF